MGNYARIMMNILFSRRKKIPFRVSLSFSSKLENGAGTRIRTVDLLITSQLLYQLSYAGFVL